MRGPRRLAWAAVAVCAFIGAAAPAASGQTVPKLDFQPCGGRVATVQCATAKVPLDYDRPEGRNIKLFVAKSPATDQAHKLGTLFFNFGGPGGTTADFWSSSAPTSSRRSTSATTSSGWIRAGSARARRDRLQGQPGDAGHLLAAVPDARQRQAASAHRQGPALHRALQRAEPHDPAARVHGERRPRYRPAAPGARRGQDRVLRLLLRDVPGRHLRQSVPPQLQPMVLDGPIDATDYVNDPMSGPERPERRLRARPRAVLPSLRARPGQLPRLRRRRPLGRVRSAGRQGRPDAAARRGQPTRARSTATTSSSASSARSTPSRSGRTSPRRWPPPRPQRRHDAARVRRRLLRPVRRRLVRPDHRSLLHHRRFRAAVPAQHRPVLQRGQRSWSEHEHTWWNNGYIELNYGLWPYRDRDAFLGPFHIPNSAVTPLVVATTYDPATPYRGAKSLVRDLGNARLLTMRGDGHTAYPRQPADCIDPAVEAYLNDGTLPAPGTSASRTCPFVQPQETAQALKAPVLVNLQPRPHMKPLPAIG